jgi:hypothetical protein
LRKYYYPNGSIRSLYSYCFGKLYGISIEYYYHFICSAVRKKYYLNIK